MSWGIAIAGKGNDLIARVGTALEQHTKYQTDAPHTVLLNKIAEAMRAFAASYPDRTVTMETSGHMDASYGNASMTLKVWP